MKEQDQCTPCEQNFENQIDHLVDEGTPSTTAQRAEREQEMTDAFAQEDHKN